MSARFEDLNGKTVFVTGGSRGIGAGIVKYLAEQGAKVIFTYSSNEESAKKVLDSLPGSGHDFMRMDIRSEESVNECIAKTLEKYEKIDGLVNNAGITKDQLLLRMKTEDFDDVINANLRGGFLVTKAFLKSMMKQRSGSIVNITSVIGQTGNAGQSNYAASKAGTEAFSRSMAQEVASRGIRVNCIAPGFIATDMTSVLGEDTQKMIMGKIPLQKMGSVDDIAQATGFLLSDASSYITGHTLSVNGGMYMN